MLKIVKKKIELYEVLKNIYDYISTHEFNDDELLKYKEILNVYLNDAFENQTLADPILIPFIFCSLKKAFFKSKTMKKNPKKKKSSVNSLCDSVTELDENKKVTEF